MNDEANYKAQFASYNLACHANALIHYASNSAESHYAVEQVWKAADSAATPKGFYAAFNKELQSRLEAAVPASVTSKNGKDALI